MDRHLRKTGSMCSQRVLLISSVRFGVLRAQTYPGLERYTRCKDRFVRLRTVRASRHLTRIVHLDYIPCLPPKLLLGCGGAKVREQGDG